MSLYKPNANEQQCTAAVGEVKVARVVFTSDSRWSEEVDTRIGKANTVLRELYRSVLGVFKHRKAVSF